MQPFGVAPALEYPTGELVDDLHLPVVDQIVDVPEVELLGPQGCLEMVDEVDSGVVEEILDAEHLFDPGDALLGGQDLPLSLVDLVVEVFLEPVGDLGEIPVPLGAVGDTAGDDQWSTCLVDQDRVDFVDDGVRMASLHPVVGAHRHVVPEVVEAELVVRPVGDIGVVGGMPLGRRHAVLDQPHVQPQESMDCSHPLGVTRCEIVVDGDQMHALAVEGVEIGGHGRDECLSLAGLHLGDHPPVQCGRADDLHIEMPLAQHPLGSLPDCGKGLDLELVQALAGGNATAELCCLGG